MRQFLQQITPIEWRALAGGWLAAFTVGFASAAFGAGPWAAVLAFMVGFGVALALLADGDKI